MEILLRISPSSALTTITSPTKLTRYTFPSATSGEAWFGPTRYDNKNVMRISVCNHRTSKHDVERAVSAIRAALDD